MPSKGEGEGFRNSIKEENELNGEKCYLRLYILMYLCPHPLEQKKGKRTKSAVVQSPFPFCDLVLSQKHISSVVLESNDILVYMSELSFFFMYSICSSPGTLYCL